MIGAEQHVRMVAHDCIRYQGDDEHAEGASGGGKLVTVQQVQDRTGKQGDTDRDRQCKRKQITDCPAAETGEPVEVMHGV
jgi:hypothetical protein